MSWVGDAAEVFSALGTVGAFGVALYLLRAEQQREAAREDEQRRAQAARVSAWLEVAATRQGGRELLFHVHNASEMPIYEVSLPGVLDDATDGGAGTEAQFIGLVPPGQTVPRAAPREWLRSYDGPEPVPLEFLDSAGQTWSRTEQGLLHPADH